VTSSFFFTPYDLINKSFYAMIIQWEEVGAMIMAEGGTTERA